MPDTEDDALRDAAAHRGLKLVKSRKRKAGVGDYGRYGLTDGAGKELFGFGPDGLTALPADIRDYLRKSEVSTWAQSAEVTPDRQKPSRTAPEMVAANDTEAAKGVAAAAADGDVQDKRTSQPTGAGKRPKQGSSTTKRKVAESPPPREPKAEPEPGPEPEPEPEPIPETKPEPEPKPVLAIRAAAKSDLDEIRALIGGQDPAATFASRFNELKRAGGGVIVADRGGVVGCVAWHLILGLETAPIGRVTLLVVAEGGRRQGIGRALVDAARSAMIDQGCTKVEAMSDIEVRNANGFFRALAFEQKSYRFVSDAKPKQPA